jgi:hypothetical protein
LYWELCAPFIRKNKFNDFSKLCLIRLYVFFRKDKKGINRLLEKCKANIKKLEFPRVEVMHMMQNEAGPSNNTGPYNRMGVSSDLDRQVR